MKHAPAKTIALVAAVVVLVLPTAAAHANERHFTFSEESATMPSGTFEVEPWFTVYGGRTPAWFGFDYSLEFEGGLTDNLLGAFYLNGTTAAAPGNPSAGGISSASVELKYRFSDAATDPIGFALYSEVTASPDLLELEQKFIVDRYLGHLLLGANVIVEYDWLFMPGDTEQQLELTVTLGAGYFVTPALMLGLEAFTYMRLATTPVDQAQDSVIYGGPVLAYAWHRFWVALSVMPQLVAPYGRSAGDIRNLQTENMIESRLLIGAHW